MDTKNLEKGLAAFAVTLVGVLAGAVGLAAFAARRVAGADADEAPAPDLTRRPAPAAPADPMVDPRPAADGPADGTRPLAMVAALNPAAEHAAPDLAADEPVTIHTRAPEAFRPDPTAVPTAEEREALRPATGPATGFAADRGDFAAGPARAE